MTHALSILLIAHGLPPESHGGVEQHVEGLARALVAFGHHVEVYAKTGRPDLAQGSLVPDTASELPCPVTRVVYRHEGLDSLRSLYAVETLDRSLGAFLATRRFDVAHVHHLTGISTGTLQVLRAARIPSVMTLHDYWLMCPRGQMWHHRGERCEKVEIARCTECLELTFGAWLGGAVNQASVAALHQDALRTLGEADALVVPSARALPPFEALGLATGRVHVVENGVDTRALAQVAPPPATRAGPLQVGYLGTLIPSKGLDVLVDALLRLPEGTAELHVHGNAVPYHGDHGFLTRVFQRLRPGSGVVYHGPYATKDLPQILARLDVVAAPALWHEAFGLTVREALAAGRPVIVSKVGGLQDAVKDGIEGYVVEPGDPDSLAAAIGRLAAARGPLLRMSAAARARARGFVAMAEDLVRIYRGAAHRPAQT